MANPFLKMTATKTYNCAACQSKTATIDNSKMSCCAMIKCPTCKYKMLLEYSSDDVVVNGVYDEWVSIVARQMKKKASKAEKEKEKEFL